MAELRQQTERQFLQHIKLKKNLYLEYIKNSHKPLKERQNLEKICKGYDQAIHKKGEQHG